MPAPAAEQAGGEWLLRQEGVRVPVAPVQSCPTGTPHSASPVWWVLLSQVHISGGPTGEVGGLTRVTIFGGSGSDCRASLVQTRLPSLHGSWLPPVTKDAKVGAVLCSSVCVVTVGLLGMGTGCSILPGEGAGGCVLNVNVGNGRWSLGVSYSVKQGCKVTPIGLVPLGSWPVSTPGH